ncbi:MAG TPA: hypothetical protein DEF45_14225 [Rhodopirellula sp.]|nr:hypothetical protein [Rhodopirellula sp.]
MRKLLPLIVIVVAGCGSSARNIFRPAINAGCSAAPCDASFGCNEPTGEVILKEYPVTELPIQAE